MHKVMKYEEDKRMTLKEAIKKFVRDGCSLTVGGFGARDTMSASYEIVRQRKRNLTLVIDSGVEPKDILFGAGCIKHYEGAYMGYGILGLSANFRRCVEKGLPNHVTTEDYTNYTMGLRFLAGAMDVPFMPTKSLLGSDIPRYNKKIKIIKDPYKQEQVALIPATQPDVAIVHVHRADPQGNAQILGCTALDDVKARASKHVIVTTEMVVPSEVIRRNPNLTQIPFYCVDAVVEAPYGSHPMNLPYRYHYDIMFSRDYVQEARTYEGFLKWLDDWVFGVEDHFEYCNKVGMDRLMKLSQLEYNVHGGFQL